jgi:DNA-binding winged helix-turn-helix (wHTH) protein
MMVTMTAHSTKRLYLVDGEIAPGSLAESSTRAREPTSDGSQIPLKDCGSKTMTSSEISFGPFRLRPAQRLLLEGDKPVEIGSRALDILAVLLERPTELISKEELMRRVWPNTFVEPANLTVHISALRRILRDGRDGNRFFINIPGRGYCFVAPVSVRLPPRPTLRVTTNDDFANNSTTNATY